MQLYEQVEAMIPPVERGEVRGFAVAQRIRSREALLQAMVSAMSSAATMGFKFGRNMGRLEPAWIGAMQAEGFVLYRREEKPEAGFHIFFPGTTKKQHQRTFPQGKQYVEVAREETI
jgi:hypothetical protein